MHIRNAKVKILFKSSNILAIFLKIYLAGRFNEYATL